MSVHTIFIDANIFIEMKDLGSLDWQALFPGLGELRIVVSMHVVKELDKLKNDRTERRRKRARAALHMIDTVPQRGKSTLREQPYLVTLEIALPRPHRWQEYQLLDENDPDDRLIAHLIEDGSALLVSDDSGIRIKASEYGIGVTKPPISFRLPPEESADRKKVGELTQIIEQLEDRRPRMLLKLACPTDPIVLVRPVLKPMPLDLQDDLVRRMLASHPKLQKPSNDKTPVSLARRPSPIDWVKYELNYASFIERVKQHVAGFHEKLNAAPMALEIPFEVINAGRVTLENADVSIRLEGDARLHVDEGGTPESAGGDPERFEFAFPTAPTIAPSYGVSGMHFGGDSFLQIPRIRFPGAVSFEWDIVPDDDDARRANLSNREFRVGKRHCDKIAVIPHGSLPLEVSISFALEAKDLDEVYQRDYTVRIETTEKEWTLGDTMLVEESLPDEVRKIGSRTTAKSDQGQHLSNGPRTGVADQVPGWPHYPG